MAPSERTIKKLRSESEEVGGKIYGDDDAPDEDDITRLEEDDDPLTNIGDLDNDGDVDADDEKLKGGAA
jgi:hypothetical protein